MTPRPLPQPGAAILHRLAERNEALAGDIAEGYRQTQSRVWFWRELIGAIVTGGFRRSSEIRPLKLVEFPSWRPPLETFESQRRRLQTLGLSASPVNGVGGISIVSIVFLITVVQPLLWVMLSAGLLCGVVVGIVRVKLGRKRTFDPMSHVFALR